MIRSEEELDRIGRQGEGSLDDVPFAVLLYALARSERGGLLEIRRNQAVKEIVLENGVPVHCTSNLAHETLSRFMLSAGRIDETAANECFAEACSRGLRFGDVLIERGLINAEDLRKVLQQNLARKLLDGFSWRQGTFRLREGSSEVDSTLKVNVAQLIIFGVTRFATQEQVDGSIGPLIGTAVALHPSPFFSLSEVRLSAKQQPLVEALQDRPMRIDEIASGTGMAYTDLTRLLYALTLVGIVIPADEVAEVASRASSVSKATPPPARPTAPPPPRTDDRREDIMRVVLNYRRMDPFELLDVDPDGLGTEIHDRFLGFAERFAPWQHDAELATDARHVFLAGARAYSELADPDRRKALLERRRSSMKPQATADTADRFRISTELLDPAVQLRKGKQLMAQGDYAAAITQLEFAADLDPQNAAGRAELAYCRFLHEPATGGPAALKAIEEALRVDPRCGLAMYYSGEVLRSLGRRDEAEQALRRAIKPMTPDRRPIDALKKLQSEK